MFAGTTLVLAAVTPSSHQCSSSPPTARLVESQLEADRLPLGVDRPHPVPRSEVGLRDRNAFGPRPREHLGWTPRHNATSALREVLAGMRAPSGMDTLPLAARAGGRLRLGNLGTCVGRKRT